MKCIEWLLFEFEISGARKRRFTRRRSFRPRWSDRPGSQAFFAIHGFESFGRSDRPVSPFRKSTTFRKSDTDLGLKLFQPHMVLDLPDGLSVSRRHQRSRYLITSVVECLKWSRNWKNDPPSLQSHANVNFGQEPTLAESIFYTSGVLCVFFLWRFLRKDKFYPPAS